MADQNALSTLLSSKAALDLGLITQEDFDQVKASFLKAQQIKAAVDVGLIKNEDYHSAKNEFLTSLAGGAPGAATPATSQQPTAPRPAPPQPVAKPAPAPAAPKPPPPAPVIQPPAPVAAPPKPAPPPPAAPISRPNSAASIARTGSNPDIPSNIPKMGGAKAPNGGTSMSGIACSEDAVNLYYLIKAKAAYQWAMWQVDDSGSSVVIAAVGEKGTGYNDFLANLPENDCRYGIYDYQFTGPDGQIHNKLVFFNWAPDSAKVKAKMMYASTKDFFTGHLDGISAQFQASDVDEIGEQEVGDAVRALKR